MGSPISISSLDLYARIGTASAPILFDVRRTASFEADETVIVGARRGDPEGVGAWHGEVARERSVVVYCVHGKESSQHVAAALRACDIEAKYLEGGITGWAELGLPRRKKAPASPHGWITRERPKIDRIACPWLIRRFIDPEAKFLFAPTEQVFDIAKATGAIAYDIPGAEPFSHDGEMCSFDAFLRVYDINDAIAIGDWLTTLIAAGSLGVLFRFKVSNPLLIGVTAVIGLIAFPLLQPDWVMVK